MDINFLVLGKTTPREMTPTFLVSKCLRTAKRMGEKRRSVRSVFHEPTMPFDEPLPVATEVSFVRHGRRRGRKWPTRRFTGPNPWIVREATLHLLRMMLSLRKLRPGNGEWEDCTGDWSEEVWVTAATEFFRFPTIPKVWFARFVLHFFAPIVCGRKPKRQIGWCEAAKSVFRQTTFSAIEFFRSLPPARTRTELS